MRDWWGPAVRTCPAHASGHGILYVCEAYPPEVVAEIEALEAEYLRDLASPEAANELPPIVLALFRSWANGDSD